MEKFPREIISLILDYLEEEELFSMERVSKFWRNFLADHEASFVFPNLRFGENMWKI
jgi:hypothetical protein